MTGWGGVIVLAKAPVPGRVKTRLCPPCTPEQAARIAEAALADTLATVAATAASWRAVALDGEAGPWLPPGTAVVAQRGRGLDERLAAAFDDLAGPTGSSSGTGAAGGAGPAVLIACDTPQITRALLHLSLETLARPGVDAVLGPTDDGGYWVIGLRRPQREVFLGVPMGSSATFQAQRRRINRLGLRLEQLPALRDVDYIDDAWAVAAAIPESRFAIAMAAVADTLS